MDCLYAVSYTHLSCLNFYFVLSGEVIKLLNDRYKEQSRTEYLELIEEGYDFSVRIRNYYSIRSICHRFEEYIEKAASCLKEEDCMDVAAIVKRIQREIREHYSTDISLAWVADEYGINPSYFSKKFKDCLLYTSSGGGALRAKEIWLLKQPRSGARVRLAGLVV